MSSLATALSPPTRVSLLRPDNGNVIVIFDASLSESYATTVTPTSMPVEGGETITDHLVREPIEISFTGIISDAPLGSQDQILTEGATTALSSLVPPLGVAAAGVGLAAASAIAGAPSKSMAAYQTLVLAQQGIIDPKKPAARPALVTVKTAVGTWRNMVIKSLTAPRDASSGASLTFNITFTQVEIVTPQVAEVGQFSNPGLAASKADIGNQSGGNALKGEFNQGVVGGGTTGGLTQTEATGLTQ
jgi:hypothetical protein